ncbi:MAG TPA: DNA helicase RecG, partial [Geomonas sp.]
MLPGAVSAAPGTLAFPPMPIITLSPDGTIPLPQELMDSLALRPGDPLCVELVDGTLRISLQQPAKETIAAKNSAKATKAAAAKTPATPAREELKTPIRFIKGVGPKLAEALARKGIATVEDALYLLPNRYEDRRELKEIARLRPGGTEAFFATVVSAEPQTTKGGRGYFEAIVRDETGSLTLKWFHFHPVYMKKNWFAGRRGIFIGEVAQFGLQREMHHPEVEWAADGEDIAQVMARDPDNFGRILPVYPLTEGVSQKLMRRIMRDTVQLFSRFVTGALPEE